MTGFVGGMRLVGQERTCKKLNVEILPSKGIYKQGQIVREKEAVGSFKPYGVGGVLWVPENIGWIA